MKYDRHPLIDAMVTAADACRTAASILCTRTVTSPIRCVRRAYLCREGYEHRKQWIEEWLEWLAEAFAVAVCGLSVMDNHLHVLVRLDPDVAETWSDEEVVRRWIAVYPPQGVEKGRKRSKKKGRKRTGIIEPRFHERRCMGLRE